MVPSLVSAAGTEPSCSHCHWLMISFDWDVSLFPWIGFGLDLLWNFFTRAGHDKRRRWCLYFDGMDILIACRRTYTLQIKEAFVTAFVAKSWICMINNGSIQYITSRVSTLALNFESLAYEHSIAVWLCAGCSHRLWEGSLEAQINWVAPVWRPCQNYQTTFNAVGKISNFFGIS